jgi:hypothetical protein
VKARHSLFALRCSLRDVPARSAQRTAFLLLTTLAACNPYTTRPHFTPFPTTPEVVLELPVASATRTLAEALKADTIPVERVEPRDGWLRTGWFHPADGTPVAGEPLGEDAVLVRAWVDPRRPDESRVWVEGVWRPWADPSLDARALERPLPTTHPVSLRLARVIAMLAGRYAPPDAALPAGIPEE